MALLTVYEKQGADGVTYRVALGNEATTRGDGGVPSESSRNFDVFAVDKSGSYSAASFVFFQYILSHAPRDPWGNPISDGGIELTEEADAPGRIWRGRVSWRFPTSTSGAAYVPTETGSGSGSSDSSESTAFSYVPFISGFSISGGTRHVEASYGTRAYPINGAAPDFGGGIGWNGEGFDGVDIVCPNISFDVTARTPAGLVQNFGQFLSRVAPYVGTVNADSIYGLEPGTVLFNGITSGSMKSRRTSIGSNEPYCEMVFNFTASPNVVINVGGVAVAKGGWEYLWTLAGDGGIQAVYVETVYNSSNFHELGLI